MKQITAQLIEMMEKNSSVYVFMSLVFASFG
jgi:hypothetical protein